MIILNSTNKLCSVRAKCQVTFGISCKRLTCYYPRSTGLTNCCIDRGVTRHRSRFQNPVRSSATTSPKFPDHRLFVYLRFVFLLRSLLRLPLSSFLRYPHPFRCNWSEQDFSNLIRTTNCGKLPFVQYG